ncbi:hypothetical protein K402DRAFT_373241 [Aulographum hederae CBS 113979]|uniref:Pentatricopeptide repeat domain-containing protein n=1 Tax=Aulographum hederae CBS 113979 TaxID=1176131 RepID=A0A6G1H733_9PEZI|nr:hypothetical protein K402DRAFT_373241 [Aulographum hederae CBS 113979]
MRPALNRLLAQPSALRILRRLVHRPGPCVACFAWTVPRDGRRPDPAPYRFQRGRRSRSHVAGPRENIDSHHERDEEAGGSTLPQKKRVESIAMREAEEEREISSIAGLEDSKYMTIEELLYQSDVEEIDPKHPRLVDREPHTSDMSLWDRLIHFREESMGKTELEGLFRGLRARGVELPCDNSLWQTFLQRPALFQELFDHAVDLCKRTGWLYPRLYESIIGYCVRKDPQATISWHRRYIAKLPAPADHAFSQVAKNAAHGGISSLVAFKHVYLESKGPLRVYDDLIPALLELRQYRQAQYFHEFLIRHEDRPSPNTRVKFETGLLDLWNGLPTGAPKMSLQPAPEFDLDDSSRQKERIPATGSPNDLFTRGTVDGVFGKANNIAPSGVSDPFCARLVATRAFSLETIVGGIAMLGVETIGPLTFQQIALRAPSPAGVLESLQLLRRHDLCLKSCLYSRLIRKLALDGDEQQLDDMLHGDEHPDVLEDQDLVSRMLRSFIDQNNWSAARRMLLVLSFGHDDPQMRRWNLLLQHYIKGAHYNEIEHVVTEMLKAKVPIAGESIRELTSSLMSHRRSGKNPKMISRIGHEDIWFVSGILIKIVENGGHVWPFCWREIVRRLGMTGRFGELRTLLMSLAKFYSWEHRRQFSELSPNETQSWTPKILWFFDVLFPIDLQAALMEWGLKTGFEALDSAGHTDPDFVPHPEDLPDMKETFLEGFDILLQLCTQTDVEINVGTVREVLTTRLWTLYSPSVDGSRDKMNKRAKKINPYGLEQLVVAFERMWSEAGFEIGIWRGHRISESLWKDILSLGDWHEEYLQKRPLQKETVQKSSLAAKGPGRGYVVGSFDDLVETAPEKKPVQKSSLAAKGPGRGYVVGSFDDLVETVPEKKSVQNSSLAAKGPGRGYVVGGSDDFVETAPEKKSVQKSSLAAKGPGRGYVLGGFDDLVETAPDKKSLQKSSLSAKGPGREYVVGSSDGFDETAYDVRKQIKLALGESIFGNRAMRGVEDNVRLNPKTWLLLVEEWTQREAQMKAYWDKHGSAKQKWERREVQVDQKLEDLEERLEPPVTEELRREVQESRKRDELPPKKRRFQVWVKQARVHRLWERGESLGARKHT